MNQIDAFRALPEQLAQQKMQEFPVKVLGSNLLRENL